MINHARTLLLNVDGPSHNIDAPGEEFVPADFRALTLPSYLQLPRRILFGFAPDRLYLNYRLRELMTILHSTELAQYAVDLDSRVTYWPIADDVLFQDAFGIKVESTSTAKVYITGSQVADDARGQLHYSWDVQLLEVADDSPGEVENYFLTGFPWWHFGGFQIPGSTPTTGGGGGGGGSTETVIRVHRDIGHYRDYVDITVDVSGSLTSKVPLTGSNLYLQLGHADLASLVGDTWHVTATVRPQLSLPSVVSSLENIGEPNLLELFGAAPVEPFKTFRNLWQDHPLLAYRLGGFLLAMIYRTNQLRRT